MNARLNARNVYEGMAWVRVIDELSTLYLKAAKRQCRVAAMSCSGINNVAASGLIGFGRGEGHTSAGYTRG